MIKKLFSTLLFICITLLACNETKKNDTDIYKTEDDMYASKNGKFSIGFPFKPQLKIIESNIGDLKFNTYSYQLNYGDSKFYTVSYMDYPLSVMKSLSHEDILKTSINFMQNAVGAGYNLDVYEDVKLDSLVGKHYTLNTQNKLKPSVDGKILINNNRVYSLAFIGKNAKYNEFTDTFKVTK